MKPETKKETVKNGFDDRARRRLVDHGIDSDIISNAEAHGLQHGSTSSGKDIYLYGTGFGIEIHCACTGKYVRTPMLKMMLRFKTYCEVQPVLLRRNMQKSHIVVLGCLLPRMHK